MRAHDHPTARRSARRRTALAAATAASLAATLTLVPAGAGAVPVAITIENLGTDPQGLYFTPVYTAFHDGNFDAFNVGEAASSGVEDAAELGSFGAIAGLRTGVDPDSQGQVITAPAGFPGAPVFEPGETASTTLDVNAADNRFFTFISMIVPSNDAFFGSETAIEVFDSNGTFLPQVITITGADIYDAGTEANDPADGPAFVAGQDPTGGTETLGVIALHPGLDNFDGVSLPNGQTFSAAAGDFGGNRSLPVARITIAQVPEPATLALVLGGLIGLGTAVRRR